MAVFYSNPQQPGSGQMVQASIALGPVASPVAAINETGRSILIDATVTCTDTIHVGGGGGTNYNETGLSITVAATIDCTARASFRNSAVVFSTAPVLAYDFAESGTTVIDRTGNGNNATMRNNTTATDLHSSGELLISATQHNLIYTPSVKPTSNASFSCTIRIPSGSTTPKGSIWSLMNSLNTSGFNVSMRTDFRPQFVFRGASGVAFFDPMWSVFTEGNTYQICVTYASGSVRAYVDRVEVTAVEAFPASPITSVTGNLNITGTDWITGYNPLNPDPTYGSPVAFDNFRFFHVTLTPTEVGLAALVPVDAVLGLSVTATATVTATDVVHRKELGPLSIEATATVTVTTVFHNREPTALAVPATATVTLTAVFHNKEPAALSVEATATVTVTTVFHNREPTALPVSATVEVTVVDTVPVSALTVSTVAEVTVVDRAHFRDPALTVPATVEVTVTDFGAALKIQATATVTGTDRAHFFEPALTVPIDATVTVATRDEETGLSIPITATITCTDYTEFPVVQAGFRWRNDDGSQATATWRGTQNVNAPSPVGSPVRLRVLLDSAINPVPKPYKLFYKKSTDSTWLPVQVGPGGTSGAVKFGGTLGDDSDGYSLATAGFAGSAFTIAGWFWLDTEPRAFTYYNAFWSVEHPTETARTSLMTTLNGHTMYWSTDVGGKEAGYMNYGAWYYIACVNGGGIGLTDLMYWSPGTDPFTVEVTDTGPGDPTHQFYIGQSPRDVTARLCGRVSQLRIWTTTLTQTELEAERYALTPARSTNLWAWWSFASGPQTTDDSGNGHTLTQLGTPTTAGSPNPITIAPPPVYVATSTNITPAGEDTTPQLVTPSGKTLADFSTGRIWDDKNGVDQVDI